MIIEFFGVSGVGKTKLSATLRQMFDDRGEGYVTVNGKSLYGGHLTPNDRRYAVMRCVLRSPGTMLVLLLHLVRMALSPRTAPGSIRGRLRTAIKWWSRLAIYIVTVRELKKSHDIHFLERGIATNLLSILVRIGSINVSSLNHVLSARGALSDVVVIVQASSEKVHARRKMRGNPEKSWMQNQDHEWHRFSIIKGLMESNSIGGADRTIEINAEEDGALETNALQLMQEILQRRYSDPEKTIS